MSEVARIEELLRADVCELGPLTLIEEVGKDNRRSSQIFIFSTERKNLVVTYADNSDAMFYVQRTDKLLSDICRYLSELGVTYPEQKRTSFGNQYCYRVENFVQIRALQNYTGIKASLGHYYQRQKEIPLRAYLDRSIAALLETWPEPFRLVVRMLDEFDAYLQEFSKYQSIKLCFEHGDFTCNNLGEVDGVTCAVDFEFSRALQPAGFDLFDLCRSINQKYDGPYADLNRLKYQLIEKANYLYDQEPNFFTRTRPLGPQHDTLVAELEVDNPQLQSEFLNGWLEQFGPKDSIYVYTLAADKITGFAPFYRSSGKLKLIGTLPDYCDQSPVFCTNDRAADALIEFMSETKLDLRLRCADGSSILVRRLLQTYGSNKVSINQYDCRPILDLTQPSALGSEKRLRQLVRKISQAFDCEVQFSFDHKLSEEEVDLLFELYCKRWRGGIVGTRQVAWIKSVLVMSSVCISKLSVQEKTLAYHIGIRHGATFISMVPIFDTDHSEYSPGKVLLMMLIRSAKDSGIKVFDFGRGIEPYKYAFPVKDKPVVSISMNATSLLKRAALWVTWRLGLLSD